MRCVKMMMTPEEAEILGRTLEKKHTANCCCHLANKKKRFCFCPSFLLWISILIPLAAFPL